MRAVVGIVAVLLLAAVAWIWLVTGGPRGPAPIPETVPAEDDATPPPRPGDPVTSALVIRLRTEDGEPVPAGARAGYLRPEGPRLRAAAEDGTYTFADAPVGPLEVVADVPGYRAAPAKAVVVPGVPTEVVVVLTRP